MKIVPAMDLYGGEVVRLHQGEFDKKTVYGSPAEIAEQLVKAKVERLHVVDLEGARKGTPCHLQTLQDLAKKGFIIDYSGGIRTDDELQAAFDAGATYVMIGTLGVRDPVKVKRWLSFHGTEKFILAADVRKEEVVISGWTEKTGKDIFSYLKEWQERGLTRCMVTSVEHDGTLKGPATELYKKLLQQFPSLFLIASGGVGKIADLTTVAQVGVKEVIVGKALYEGAIPFNYKECHYAE